MSSTQWIYSKTPEDVVPLDVHPRAFALIVIGSDLKRSCAKVVSSSEVASAFLKKDSEYILRLIPQSGLKLSEVSQIRLVGRREIIARLKSTFAFEGVLLGKDLETDDLASIVFLPFEGRLRVQRSSIKQSAQVENQGQSIEAPTQSSRDSTLRPEKKRVLVVDDSETIRKLLTQIIDGDPSLHCVGAIANPLEVEAAIQKLKPDVISLDIHMPDLNGVELLKKIIMPKFRIPCVMISSLSKEDGTYVLDALEAGAVDYIQKPTLQELDQAVPVIREKIRAAAESKLQSSRRVQAKAPQMDRGLVETIDKSYLVCIGSSTGGTEALKDVLTALPEGIPPIVIVQHIPPVFSRAFADRMNQLCKFEVKEAADGDLVIPGRVLIAPGGFQMKLKEVGNDLRVMIEDAPPVNRHKPSVDFTFDSVAALRRRKVVGVILTGMGADGAKGLLHLKETGATTLGQNEETCVVYGMPREAAKIGAVQTVLPLHEIAREIVKSVQFKGRALMASALLK